MARLAWTRRGCKTQISVVGNAFHETPTRNAFSSFKFKFAVQIHGMNQFMGSTSENSSVLARRSESFSPSKHNSQFGYHPPLNITPPSGLFPSSRLTASAPGFKFTKRLRELKIHYNSFVVDGPSESQNLLHPIKTTNKA